MKKSMIVNFKCNLQMKILFIYADAVNRNKLYLEIFMITL